MNKQALCGLYAFGRGDSGQLGLGSGEDSNQNHPLPCVGVQGQEFTQISCGGSHCAILFLTGELYTFGNNDYGQLGRTRRLGVPTLVEGIIFFFF